MHLDMIVIQSGVRYPIELKYKTARFEWISGNEAYLLKNHGAQDIGKYDCLIDIMRIEHLATILPDYGKGYVVWLTNDPSYWTPFKSDQVIYRDFSLHEGSLKTGTMRWATNAGYGTTKNREKEICFSGNYSIHWQTYSHFHQQKNGDFRYALIEIKKN